MTPTHRDYERAERFANEFEAGLPDIESMSTDEARARLIEELAREFARDRESGGEDE